MNPDTNELRSVDGIKELLGLRKKGFIPVPKNLERAARLKLGKKKKVIVSRTSGGKLSRWALRKRRRRVEVERMVANCNAYYGS